MSSLLALASLLASQPTYSPTGPRLEVTLADHRSFIITTDAKSSPKTVQAVLNLVKRRFYDGLKVHRVEKWVVQWGDPKSKTLALSDPRLGSTGSGTTLPFESPKVQFMRGVVGVASPYVGQSGDGQLFVLTKNAPRLNGGYGILGKVTSGMDVVDHIRLGDQIQTIKVLSK